MDIYIYIWSFILGTIFGSFLNAFLYRYITKNKMTGRSFCPKCKHQLAWYDLIPIVSWFLLNKKCRYCKSQISFQYPLVEIISGLIFTILAWRFSLVSVVIQLLKGYSNNVIIIPAFLVACMFFMVLLLISLYDLKTKEIPNGFNLTIVALGFIYLLIKAYSLKDINVISYGLVSGIAAFLFFYFFVWISKESWMGGGDAKLAFGLGIFFGPKLTFLALLISTWLGALVGIALIINSKRSYKKTRKDLDHEIPFGPFLAAGSLVTILYGSKLVDLYVKIFLG